MYRSVRKILFCLLLIMIATVCVAAQDTQKTIKIGMDMDYPPFSFLDKNTPVGLNVDVIQELNRYSPQELDVALDTWSTVLSNLNSGKIDAVSGILYTEERAKIYDFTRPYSMEPAVVFVSKTTNASSIQDLYNKKLANLKDDYLAENMMSNNGVWGSVENYDTYTEVFSSLETGKADFAIAPYSLGMEIINKHGYHNVTPIGSTVSTYQYRIAVKKGNTELVNMLNVAIDKMRETDFPDKNRQKWIKYRNDGASWSDFLKFSLYILIPAIILILIIDVYILKREITRKTILLQDRNEELTKLAMLDPGTELYNRRRFYELAEREFSKAKKSGSTFGLLMVDIDWFKKINDTFGHDVGDQVISHFAQECKSYFRNNDVICRFGGEEFIILLPMTPEERTIKVAERIRDVINHDEIMIPDGRIVSYTISIGVATFKRSDEVLEQTIKRADSALYQAKEEGRNRIVMSS